MKYAVKMGSDVMIYIPNFIMIGSAIQKLIWVWWGWGVLHRQHGDRISLLLFFENEESRLKVVEFQVVIGAAMKSIILRHVAHGERTALTLLAACLFASLLFISEDGGGRYLRGVCKVMAGTSEASVK
jgi:hypothetical protein